MESEQDADVDACLADAMFLKLEVIELRNSLHILRQDNTFLRKCLEESKVQRVRTLSEEAKRKLAFYHTMKDKVKDTIPITQHSTSWHAIKQRTDELYDDAKHGDAKHDDAKHGDAKHDDAKHGDAKHGDGGGSSTL